jgi:peptidoglycan lytic transglycosylase G
VTTSGRDGFPRQDGTHGSRQGSVTGVTTPVSGYRRRRTGTSLRGLVVLLGILVVVVGAGIFLAAPTLRHLAFDLARDNPQALGLPFVGDAVRGELGDALTSPAGTNPTPVSFSVAPGDTVRQIGQNLTNAGLIAQPMVFQYLVVSQSLDSKLQTGTFNLTATMTPQQIVDRLLRPPDPPPSLVTVALKKGLRIEQIAAYLQTLELTMNVHDWYVMATDPPANVLADYPWLKELPKGKSLEGFLGSGVFQVQRDITPEDLLRKLLDLWDQQVGQDVIDEATAKGETFYDVLRLASIVERETAVDTERVKVAGVYTNRLNGLAGNTLLNAEPTVIYAVDTMALRKLAFTSWPRFAFWGLTGYSDLNQVQVSPDLEGYQSWHTEGLPPTPIDSPSVESIEAAISPDTSGHYLYFYACPGQQKHKFAKTLAQQTQNIASCKPVSTPKP